MYGINEFTYKHFRVINRHYFDKIACVVRNKYIHKSQGINQIPMKVISGRRLIRN